MKTKLKISFCTVSMNRLHHLKQTLLKNIEDNISYGMVEFVLLDYNSNDGLSDWVKENLTDYIKKDFLKFYRTSEPRIFDRSHSRNMAFKLATGDIICNVDADNFTGEGFAFFINENLNFNSQTFMTPSFIYRDVIGRLVIRKVDFYFIQGYNETLKGYGFEDMELYFRLKNKSFKHTKFFRKEFMRAIHHSNDERFLNEHIGINCDHIYLSYLNPFTTEIIYSYKDGTYLKGVFLDNEDKNEHVQESEFDNKIVLVENWKTGEWTASEKEIIFNSENNIEKYSWTKLKDSLFCLKSKKRYFRITNPEFLGHLKLLKSEIDNRLKLKEYMLQSDYAVNPNGFGQGTVTRNFETILFLN